MTPPDEKNTAGGTEKNQGSSAADQSSKDPKGFVSDVEQAVRRRFSKRDIILMAVSLFFALLVWLYVLNMENPYREKVVREVPITLAGESAMESTRNLMLLGGSEALSEGVTVTLNVPFRQFSEINAASVNVQVNLSGITSAGTFTLPVQATVSSGYSDVSVVSVSPSQVEVQVELIEERELPVELELTGTLPEGYWADTADLTPSTVVVSGAATELSKIDRAVATLDLDGLTGSVHRSLSVKLYDAEGNEVDYSQFSGTMPYVVCQMEVLPTKTVPVDYASAIYGADELAEGYELESVTVLPEETVTLAGEQSVLDGIESVSVAAIDIGGMSESYIAEDIEFLLPEGVVLTGSSSYRLYIKINEEQISRTFYDVPIEVRNLGSGLHAELSIDAGRVMLSGGRSAVNSLSARDVELFVDASGLAAGEHEVSVQCSYGELSDTLTALFWPGTLTLTITD